MVETLDEPTQGSESPKKKAKAAKVKAADAAEATAPTFEKGERVWFWLGDDPESLEQWAADIVGPSYGFEGHYQIVALVPGGPQFLPMAKAVAEPTALCVSPKE